MTIAAQPIQFQPIYKETIWGGHALASRFNRPVAADRSIGESWEIVSHGSDQSAVVSGPLAGMTLGNLVTGSAPDLIGAVESFGKFPLLVKFIDACDRLSVQVHPDDRQARSQGWGEFGKTECWYVIEAPADGRVIVGFKSSVTRADIQRAIENNTLETLLGAVPIRSGDVVFLPAGTVHAILEGTLLYEIQETSDATLRLYDWGRVDARGTPRPLHVRDALGVMDTEARAGYVVAPITLDGGGIQYALRIACRYFALEEYRFFRDADTILPAKRSFRIVTVLSGTLALKYPDGGTELAAGTTVLLPALMQDVRARGSKGTSMLVSSVPDLQAEIIAPLATRGIPRAQILAIGGCSGHNDLLPYFA